MSSLFLFIIKILIIAFTLYTFFKNHQKADRCFSDSEEKIEEDSKIEEYQRLLKVTNNFDSASLKQAYRKMVKINHPDLFKTPKEKERATEKMMKLNEAYKVLSEYLQYREYYLQA